MEFEGFIIVDKSNKIKITTEPDGASIYLDDKFLGKSPIDQKINFKNKYVISIKKENYDDIVEEVSIINYMIEKNYNLKFNIKKCNVIEYKLSNYNVIITTTSFDIPPFILVVNNQLPSSPDDGDIIFKSDKTINQKQFTYKIENHKNFKNCYLKLFLNKNEERAFQLISPDSGSLIIK